MKKREMEYVFHEYREHLEYRGIQSYSTLAGCHVIDFLFLGSKRRKESRKESHNTQNAHTPPTTHKLAMASKKEPVRVRGDPKGIPMAASAAERNWSRRTYGSIKTTSSSVFLLSFFSRKGGCNGSLVFHISAPRWNTEYVLSGGSDGIRVFRIHSLGRRPGRAGAPTGG